MKNSQIEVVKLKIEKQRENLEKILSDNIQAVFYNAGIEWLERFPKRKLELVSGMGTAFWVIDGKILQHDFESGYDSDGRIKYGLQCNGRIQLKNYWLNKRDLFLPLLQAFEFLAEVLENNECDSQYLVDIKF